jgi:hypothetical protein
MKTESLIPHEQVFYAPLMSMLDESVTSAIFGNLEDVSRLIFSLRKPANVVHRLDTIIQHRAYPVEDKFIKAL